MRFKLSAVFVLTIAFLISMPVNAQFGFGKGALGGGKKTNVNDVLLRVQVVKQQFFGATRCLRQGRDIIFDISATNEKKRQLQQKEAELAAAENKEDQERITVEIEQMKQEEIDRAQKSGEMENRRLTKEQAKSVGKLSFNITLAIMLDKSALENAPKVRDDAQEAIENAKKNKLEWLRIATKAKELTEAISKDIPMILAEAPHQLETLGALLESCNSLKTNNEIEDFGKPAEDTAFLEIEYTPTPLPPAEAIVEGEAAECYFTSFFIGNTSDFDPAFIEMSKSGDFAFEAAEFVQSALEAIPQLNLVPLETGGSTELTKKVDPRALFIRGLISRADVKKVEKFASDEYAFTTTASLEFFDLVSGEVFYTRTLSGQFFTESPKGEAIASGDKGEYFKKCLKGTVEEIVKRLGEDYMPGMVEGHIVDIPDAKSAVLDIGRKAGVYQGMTFYIYNDPASQPLGMLKTSTPQDKLSAANILFINGNIPAEKGWTVRSFGVNRLNLQKGLTRYMVADFSPAIPEDLPAEFAIDTQSMGQWLHDGLSQYSNLFLLAPLLAKVDSAGQVVIQNALYDAQLKYSIFGGLSLSTAMGNRAYPDVFIKGVVTHAKVQTYITPGAENKILEAGVSIEFYDRKTRDFLFATQHSGYKVEKIVVEGEKVYRALELEASFRDLAKKIISESAKKVAFYYKPTELSGEIASIAEDGASFTTQFNQPGAGSGDLFQLITHAKEITNLEGEVIGSLEKNYGIAKLGEDMGENKFGGAVLVSDGQTKVKVGDRLTAEGKSSGATAKGKLCQVFDFEAGGNIDNHYLYSSGRMMEWLHDALLTTGKYRMLPPNFREAAMGTAEIGISTGQFELADLKEIIYQGFRHPEVFIQGKLLQASADRKVGEFKDKIILKATVEISFVKDDGEVLYTNTASGEKTLELQKSRGETVVGTEEVSPEFDELVQDLIKQLSDKAKGEVKI